MAYDPGVDTDSGATEDINGSSSTLGSYSPATDRMIGARMKLSSLNGAAATFTVGMVDANGDFLVKYSMPKGAAADTVAYLPFDPIFVAAAETVSVYILSSNTSDTSVTWAIEWLDALGNQLESTDSGATTVAREGSDGSTHTLDTLSTQVSQIGSGGGSAVNEFVIAAPNGFVITTGASEVNDEDSTVALDGVLHQISDNGGTLDVYYLFEISGGFNPNNLVHVGRMNGGNDDVDVYANTNTIASPTWVKRATIEGQNTSVNSHRIIPLAPGDQMTGADAGKVAIRFQNTGLTSATLSTDQILVEKTFAASSTGYVNGAYWIKEVANGGTAGTVYEINGTAENPCPYADALTMNAVAGQILNRFEVANGESVTLSADSSNFTFFGDNYDLALGSQTIDDIAIHDAHITGTGTSAANALPHIFNGSVSNVTMGPCSLKGTSVNGTFTGNLAGGYSLKDCKSLVAGAAVPNLVFSGLGSAVAINNRGWNGGSNYTLDLNCTVSHEVEEGGAQTFTTGGAAVEVRGIFTSLDVDLSSAAAGLVQFVGITGPITITDTGTATGTVNLYGAASSVTDSTAGSTTINDMTLPAVAESKTWYVATAALGGSDSNSGRQSSPFLTPEYAVETAAAEGDTIIIGPGTFVLSNLQSLSPKSGQTLIGSGSDETIIQGNSQFTGVIYCAVVSSVTIKKLKAESTRDTGIGMLVGVSEGCVFEDVIFDGNKDGARCQDADRAVFCRCHFISEYDALIIHGSSAYAVDCHMHTTAARGSSIDPPGAFRVDDATSASVESSVTLERCYLQVTRATDEIFLCMGVEADAHARLTLIDCNIRVESTSGTDTENIYGIYADEDAWVRVRGGTIETIHAGSGAVYDLAQLSSSQLLIDPAISLYDSTKTTGTITTPVKTDTAAILVDTAEIGTAGVGLTEVRVSDAGLAEFATNDTGETVGADGSVAKISQGTLAASAIADAVWDEATSSHVDPGSFGVAVTNIVNRIGAFTGTGVNTILGFLKAGLSKNATTPSDIGDTFAAASDANEALKDRLNKVPTNTCVTLNPSTGELDDNPRLVYQYETFGPEEWTILDADGEPVDLSVASLEFRVYADSDTVLWTIDSSGTSNGTITVGGDDNNEVTVTDDNDTNLQTSGLFRYVLWDTTNDKVRARGKLNVEAEANSV